MGFSTIPLPAMPPGGLGMQAMQQGNALSAQNLENQKNMIANQINAPYAQMAQPFATAALQQAQAQPKLTLGQANQANAQAGYLGTEADINRYKLNKGGAYVSPEGFLYSQGFPGADNSGAPTNTTVNEHGVIVGGGAVPAPTPVTVNPSPQPTVQAATSDLPTTAGGAYVNPLAALNAQQPVRGSANPLATPVAINAPTAPVNAIPPVSTMGTNAFNQGSSVLNFPPPQNYAQMLMQQRLAQSQSAMANAQKAIMQKNAYAYSLMTPDAKNQQDAIFNGAGIDQYEARNELAAGKTPQQILAERGINIADVKPQYLATPADIKQVNQRKAAIAEINSLGKIVQTGLAPYIQTINGRSYKQIADAISGDDPAKQVAFLEAYGIMPDLAAMRGKAIGLNVGKGVLNQLEEKMMGNIKPFQALVDPKVYAAAQAAIDRDVTNAGNAANDAITNTGQSPSNSKANDPLGIR